MMGYRVRLGRFPKAKREKYMHLKSEQEAHDWFEENTISGSHYRPPEHQELIELGKYVDYKNEDLNIEDFYNFELEENDFVIVDRDFLLHVIEVYRISTEEWYRELYESVKEGDTAQVEMHVRNKVSEWDTKYFNNLKTDTDYDADANEDGRLTRSWKFEYAVFNLLFILHTFDWDNDYLIYSGW